MFKKWTNQIHFRFDKVCLLTAEDDVFTSNPKVIVIPSAMPRLLKPLGGDISINQLLTLSQLHKNILHSRNFLPPSGQRYFLI